MKVKILINTRKAEDADYRRSVIWEGDLEILDDEEYLTMISVIGEGIAHPICQVPFATGIGHWVWIAPDHQYDEGDYNYG